MRPAAPAAETRLFGRRVSLYTSEQKRRGYTFRPNVTPLPGGSFSEGRRGRLFAADFAQPIPPGITNEIGQVERSRINLLGQHIIGHSGNIIGSCSA